MAVVIGLGRMTETTLGLVVALPAEARMVAGRRGWRRQERWKVLNRTHAGGTDLIFVCCGMGIENAYRAACWLIDQGITTLAALGVSGGLNPDLLSGDLVVPETILEARTGGVCRKWIPESRFVNRLREGALLVNLSVRGGSIVTTPMPVLTRQEKTSLYSDTGAQAVDMESAAVARAAADRGLPMFALRTVCDTASDDLPAKYMDFIAPDGSVRWSLLPAYLLRRPSRMGQLIRHGKRFSDALSALGRGWRLCGLSA